MATTLIWSVAIHQPPEGGRVQAIGFAPRSLSAFKFAGAGAVLTGRDA